MCIPHDEFLEWMGEGQGDFASSTRKRVHDSEEEEEEVFEDEEEGYSAVPPRRGTIVSSSAHTDNIAC